MRVFVKTGGDSFCLRRAPLLRHAVFVDMLVNFRIVTLARFMGANRDLNIYSFDANDSFHD